MNSSKTAAELKRVCEATALLKIWRRHRKSTDDTLFAFADWTLNHPDIVAAEMPAEIKKTMESLPNGSDDEKINHLRSAVG